jgi:cytochrome c oxidase subunit 2
MPQNEPEERRVGRRDLTKMAVIAVISTVIGIAFSLAIHWFPTQASAQAKQIDTLYDVLLVASVPVFVLVETIVLFSVWKFRMKPGEENLDGPPMHGSTRLEVVWTAFPAILMVALCGYAYGVLTDIEKKHKNELHVNVTGQQFAWSYEYPQAGGKKVMSNQLYLPCDPEPGAGTKARTPCTGRPVKFDVRAKDVIHDFWVPAFRMKIDAVPGVVTSYRVTPSKLGRYSVVCAELCGLGHATMRSSVHVVPSKEFDDWLQGKINPKAPGGGGSPANPDAAGKAIFTGQEGGCGSCHTLADAGTSGTVGPDLDKALKGKDEAFIKQSIITPNAVIAPGYPKDVMPQDFGKRLTPDQIDALVAYLAKVTK